MEYIGDEKNKAALFKKIASMQGVFSHVQKTGQTNSYKYLTLEDISPKWIEALETAKLAFLPSTVSKKTEPFTTNNKQGYTATVQMKMTFCDPDTGAAVSVSWDGSCSQYGAQDKPEQGCVTVCMKYFKAHFLGVAITNMSDEVELPDNQKKEPKKEPEKAPKNMQPEKNQASKKTTELNEQEKRARVLDYLKDPSNLEITSWFKVLDYKLGDIYDLVFVHKLHNEEILVKINGTVARLEPSRKASIWAKQKAVYQELKTKYMEIPHEP